MVVYDSARIRPPDLFRSRIASGIRLARALQRRRDCLPRGHNHLHIDALDGNFVAGLHHQVLAFGHDVHVRLHALDREIVQLHIFAVVHESYDGNLRRQRRDSAHVVAIVVRHHHIVDLLHTDGLAGFKDAGRIAVARDTGVDNHSLARGRNKQRRLRPFQIDDIHVERLGR